MSRLFITMLFAVLFVGCTSVVQPKINAFISYPDYGKEYLVNLTKTGGLDWMCFTYDSKDSTQIIPFEEKIEGKIIQSVKGISPEKHSIITGLHCGVGIFTNGTRYKKLNDLAFSAGYSGEYENIKNSSIVISVVLSPKTKVVHVFGYSNGVGAIMSVKDEDGNIVANVLAEAKREERKPWLLTLEPTLMSSSTYTINLGFQQRKGSQPYAQLAIGAITANSEIIKPVLEKHSAR